MIATQLSTAITASIPLGSDEVGDLWRPLDVKTANGILHDAIGVGHPLVLTQVFEPRFD